MGKLRKVKKLLNSGRAIKELSNDELIKLAENDPFERLIVVLEDEMVTRLIKGSVEMKRETEKAKEAKQGTNLDLFIRTFTNQRS